MSEDSQEAKVIKSVLSSALPVKSLLSKVHVRSKILWNHLLLL